MPTNTTRTLIGLLCFGITGWAGAGCGGDPSACGPGHDEVPVRIEDPSQLDTYWVASLAVDELEVVGAGASHDTLIQAHFSDFSDYMVQLAEFDDFYGYPACILYTSRPVPSGDPIPLHVDSVTFSGLNGGDLVLEPDEFEHIPTELLGQRGFAAEAVGVEVDSPDDPADFPAFTSEIPAPVMPQLTRLGDLSPVDLAQGPPIGIDPNRVEPLQVEWVPSGADYVEVKILPGAGSETPYAKLRCITFDDGCLEIPAAALGQLALDTASNFRFRIENHHFVLESFQEGDQTKAAAEIDTSATLEGTVRR